MVLAALLAGTLGSGNMVVPAPPRKTEFNAAPITEIE
jgi:hypothetical protein